MASLQHLSIAVVLLLLLPQSTVSFHFLTPSSIVSPSASYNTPRPSSSSSLFLSSEGGGQGFSSEERKNLESSIDNDSVIPMSKELYYDKETGFYAPLGKHEIEYFLNYVTVYAITSKSDTNSLFLVQEKKGEEQEEEKSKNVGYFFISKDMANDMLSKLNKKSREDAEIQGYYLGRVWNTLLFPPVESPATEEVVEYRIIPSTNDVAQAQEMYQKSIAGDDTKKVNDAPFQNKNEVPIFMDLNLRLATPGSENENEACFPMYLSYQDLISTCQDYAEQEADGSGTEKPFQPMISIGELTSLVKQMKQPSQTDFRIAALVGPTMKMAVMKDEEGKEKEEAKKEQEKVKETLKNKNKRVGKKDDEDDDSSYEPTIQW